MKKLSYLWLLFFILSCTTLFISRTIIGHWVPYMWIPFFASFLFPLLLLATDFHYIKRKLSSYRTKLIVLVFRRALLVVGILVFIGFFIQKADVFLDLSYQNVNSIEEQAVSALKALEKPVKVYGFYQKEKFTSERENLRLLLARMQKHTDLVSLEILDAAKNPAMVEKFGIKRIPSIVVEVGKRKGVLQQWSEEILINEMSRLQKERNSRLCLLEGFGSIPIVDSSSYRLLNFKDQLYSMGYTLQSVPELSLLKKEVSCDLIVLAGPKEKIPELLQDRLREALLGGVSVLIAVDSGKNHSLHSLFKDFGIQYFNNFVIDMAGEKAGFNAATVIGSKWSDSLKLGKLLKKYAVVLPVAGKLEVVSSKYSSFKAEVLLQSGKESFVKNKLQSEMEFKPGIDEEGPFALAALSRSDSGTLAVVSDADFFTDEYFAFQGNREFSLQLVSELVAEKGEINLPPKNFYKTMFVLTPVFAKSYLLFGVLPFPFVLFALSLWFWFKRKSA